ncbi:MFS transporter [uncultured Parasutterella sp.]|mgnify:CR=1 FL=1|uniref:MFS transporter n=1 Tax=uncultured Parasutterella sp. TaxID=1263098 RepID=UPI002597B3D7|nr:MFS transporter [uncultured Parasutterella sp.]
MFHPLRSKAACAVFFFLTGLYYGLIVSRLPAIKMHVGLSDSQIGLCLFMFGCFGLLGLLFSPKLISRFSSRMVLCVNAVLCFLGLLGIGFAQTVPQIFVAFGICGFSVSLLDGAMNTQGVLYEKASKRPTLNLFHAFYSLGAVFASAAGSVCAALAIGSGINFLVASAAFVVLSLSLSGYLLSDRTALTSASTGSKKHRLPAVVMICAVCSLLAYASEGTVGEWGGLYLTGDKGADQSVAALVYGLFSIVTFFARLAGDPLRTKFGENNLMLCGLALALAAMGVVLKADSAYTVLAAYAVMGLGFAHVIPTLFSIAGRNGIIPAASATAAVAFMSYAGLLFVPPCIGWVAQHFSLHAALCLVPVMIAVTFILTLRLRSLSVRNSELTP